MEVSSTGIMETIYIADSPTTSITHPAATTTTSATKWATMPVLVSPKAFPVGFFPSHQWFTLRLVQLMITFKSQPNKEKHNLAETNVIKKTWTILMFEKEKPFIDFSPHFCRSSLAMLLHSRTLTFNCLSKTDHHWLINQFRWSHLYYVLKYC